MRGQKLGIAGFPAAAALVVALLGSLFLPSLRADDAVITTAHVAEKIHGTYERTVRPILKEKCFACHDATTPLFLHGWGGRLNPLASEQRTARSLIDMSRDFGSTTALPKDNALPLLKIMAESGAMPPADYTRIHKAAKLTDAERAAIAKWVDASTAEIEHPQADADAAGVKQADAAGPSSAPASVPSPNAAGTEAAR